MVGLDIGSKTIKMVEVEKNGANIKLVGSGIVGYQSPLATSGEERKPEDIANLVRKLHKEAKIGSREVAIALPEPLVFTRTIKFPLLTDKEIASAIMWEAEQYIPIPINEAIIQHQILERRESVTPGEVMVLLVAAPRALVQKYINVVQMAGLSVVGVETELIALVRGLAPVDTTTLLVDFGARSTDIAISKNGNLYFSRSIPTAGEAFTRAVAQGLGIEFQQAEEYKRTYGLSASQLEGKIRGAIDPVFRLVSDEIKKSIHFYQTEDRGEIPSSVILSGGTTGMPEAVSVLSNHLGIEVVVGNPFHKLEVDDDAAKLIKPYAPLYSIAVGLAEREK